MFNLILRARDPFGLHRNARGLWERDKSVVESRKTNRNETGTSTKTKVPVAHARSLGLVCHVAGTTGCPLTERGVRLWENVVFVCHLDHD